MVWVPENAGGKDKDLMRRILERAPEFSQTSDSELIETGRKRQQPPRRESAPPTTPFASTPSGRESDLSRVASLLEEAARILRKA